MPVDCLASKAIAIKVTLMIAIPLIPALDNPITKAAKKLRIHEVVLISDAIDKNICVGQKRRANSFDFPNI